MSELNSHLAHNQHQLSKWLTLSTVELINYLIRVRIWIKEYGMQESFVFSFVFWYGAEQILVFAGIFVIMMIVSSHLLNVDMKKSEKKISSLVFKN